MTANPIEQLRDAIVASLPEVVATIDPPADATGRWFADFTLGMHQVVVEWVPERGFGVSAQPEPGFGEGPEEAFVEAGAVAARVLELLRTRGRTQAPREVRLRELREQVAR